MENREQKDMIISKFIIVAIIAYLLGAIPFGIIISKLMANINITEHGSGNIGGTNVLRTLGTKAGGLVVIFDLGKAIGAVLLAKLIIGDSVLFVGSFPLDWQVAQVIAAMMSMVGHNWSVYIGFRGGKGVAAYFGGWLAMAPITALIGAVILIITAIVTRYMSRASILGAIGIFCFVVFLTLMRESPPFYLIYSLVAVALIIYQHRGNITRLRTGTESTLYIKDK